MKKFLYHGELGPKHYFYNAKGKQTLFLFPVMRTRTYASAARVTWQSSAASAREQPCDAEVPFRLAAEAVGLLLGSRCCRQPLCLALTASVPWREGHVAVTASGPLAALRETRSKERTVRAPRVAPGREARCEAAFLCVF